jgi:chromosome segregation ATPase
MGSTFIKEIILDGFKSFGEKVSIKLGKGFTAIIGPSGTGKSNIADGLCFALGRQGKKAMRAEDLKGLIFVGTRTKKPATSAEVTVIFDNSQDSFPSFAGQDLAISREITDKNETTYRLNGARCNREEILTRLAFANVDPDGFNVVSEGKIYEIAYFSPEDRRIFIEGILKLQTIGRGEFEKGWQFMRAFDEINMHFCEEYAKLSPGGIANMFLENSERPFEGGILIEARPRGKKTSSIECLSGAERMLVAAALIFAVERSQPAPFYVMDDIDGALDGPNVHRVSMAMKEFAGSSQFIAISHREENIVNADRIYGVSMKDSISDVFSMKMD